MKQHELPDLGYPRDALEPHISAETLDYHHGKHHAAYVRKLNKALPGSGFESASLEDIITRAEGELFNNAAQAWNHAFYWKCLAPGAGGDPSGVLGDAIIRQFGGFERFREAFTDSAESNFGSGWTWLVRTAVGDLRIINTDDAENPLTLGHYPLLTCDVWEHAYYIDYRNARRDYIAAFWKLVDWDFVSERYGGSLGVG